MMNKSSGIISVITAIFLFLSMQFQTVCFADTTYWTNESEQLAERSSELEKLISECEAAGLSVEYEKLDLYIIERFIGYLNDDISKIETGGQNTLDRISYITESLKSMCSKLSESLTAYLNGSAVPKTVDLSNNSSLFNIGYLAGSAEVELDNFKRMGSNYTIFTIPMRDVIKEGGAPTGFTVMKSAEGENVYYKLNQKSSGNNILTISAKKVKTGEDFIYQNVSLEPNTEYEFGGEITTNKSHSGYIALRKTEAVGEKIDIGKIGTNNYIQTFTTEAVGDNYQFRMGLNSSNLSDVSFDNVFIRKKGTNTNLLINGGFENTVIPYTTKYGSGGIDFDVINSYKSVFERAAEKNVRFDIMLNLHEYPVFLQEANSRYMKKFSTYIPYNITDDRVRSDIGVFVKTIANAFKDVDSLGSICLLNEPEYDTRLDTEYYQSMWADYLKSVHKTAAAMNRAYGGTAYSSFESVEMPSDETDDGVFYDWKCFNEDVLADYMSFLRNSVKNVSNIPVCFKVMLSNGYTDVDGFVCRGNTALEKYAQLSDYFGCDAYGTYTKNQPLLGKTMVYDLAMSIGNKPIINAEDHVISDWINYQNTDRCYDALNAPFIASDVWMGALHGRKNTALWTLRTSDIESHYAYNSLGVHPDILSAAGKRSLDVMRLSEQVQAISDRDYDAAVIYSDSSRAYRREYINAVYNAYCALRYSGKKVKFITENQIKNGLDDLNKYKLVIVPSAQHVTDNTAQDVYDYAQSGGRLMIFDSQSLVYNEYGCTSKSRNSLVQDIHAAENTTVTDISFENYKMTEDISEEIYNAVSEIYDDTYSITDKNGNRVNAVYDITSHNGYVLINIYNPSAEEINVSISDNGAEISRLYDLFNEKEIMDSSIRIEPYETVFLKAEQLPVKITGNISEKTMNINGRAHTPNDMVSIAVYKPSLKNVNIPLRDDIIYINEKKCNATGDFTFDIKLKDVTEGEYRIIIRLRNEENKLSETYQYEFFVPEISITCGDKSVTEISELSENDVIIINLGIKNKNKRDFKGNLYCAQYNNGMLADVFAFVADSDFSQNQTVIKSFKVGKLSENSVIKIMFWERDSNKPFISAYVID